MATLNPILRSGGRIALGFLTGALVAACTGAKAARPAETPPEGSARLEVVNRSVRDMDIYLVHAGQRIRLGLAPNGETTWFSLSQAQLTGVGLSQFEAVPLLAGSSPVRSEPIKVKLQDVVTFDIPPP